MSTASTTSATAAPGARTPGGIVLPVIGIAVAILLIVVGSLLASRRDEELPTAYGRRRGGEAGRSVNGTAVLAEMFKDAGKRVTTLSRFSPRLDKYDVVVWFPNDFKPPTDDQRQYLEQWLSSGFERTVVYVGRDYNAEIAYWNRMRAEAPVELVAETLRRQAEARAAWEAARSRMPEKEYFPWFTVRRDGDLHQTPNLMGPWSEGIDGQQTELHLEGRLTIPVEADRVSSTDPELPDNFEVLLADFPYEHVYRVTDDRWSEGQVLVVANGSFLLNYPLINHEHRKLAGRLIDEIGGGQRVVFIESEAGGPTIAKKEPTKGFPTALELLKIWPLNAILLQVAVLGIILCLARMPIFGRPRELPPEPATDFGRHVEALGKLLARTKNRHYAQSRLEQYRQIAQRRSGRSHLRNK